MKIADLSRQISDSLEDLDILTKVRKGFFEITENDKNSNTTLRKVRIDNLPTKNIWVFRSEIEDIECLRNQSKTVEVTLLHLDADKLYAYMIELKSSLSKKNISEIKKKFACSLVTLSLYLSTHKTFKKLENIEIIPIGITMFNDNAFQRDFHERQLHRCSSLHKEVFRMSLSKENNCYETSVQLKTPTLGRFEIGVLFFQNLNWLPYTSKSKESESFSVDFKDFQF
ncbi:MAG: hypothetical protein ACPG5B_00725 [Chitinophagales bacterium]